MSPESTPAPALRIWVEATAAASTGVPPTAASMLSPPIGMAAGPKSDSIGCGGTAHLAGWRPGVWNWQWDSRWCRFPLAQRIRCLPLSIPRPSVERSAQAIAESSHPWPGPSGLACEWASGATPAETGSRGTDGCHHLRTAGRWLEPHSGGERLAWSWQPLWFFCAAFVSVRDSNTTFSSSELLRSRSRHGHLSNVLGCRLQPVLLRKEDCTDLHVNAIFPLGQTEHTGVL